MVQGSNWEVRLSGETLSTSSPWGGGSLSLPVGNWDKQDRVNTEPEKPQEEDCRVQKGLFESNNRIHIVGIIKYLGVKLQFQA